MHQTQPLDWVSYHYNYDQTCAQIVVLVRSRKSSNCLGASIKSFHQAPQEAHAAMTPMPWVAYLAVFHSWAAALSLRQVHFRVQEASFTCFLTGSEACVEKPAKRCTGLLTWDHRNGFESSQHSERAKSWKVSKVDKLRYVPVFCWFFLRGKKYNADHSYWDICTG